MVWIYLVANLEHCEASVEGVRVVSVRLAVARGEVLELAPLWRLLGAQARHPQRAQQQRKRTSSSHICSYIPNSLYSVYTVPIIIRSCAQGGESPHEPRPLLLILVMTHHVRTCTNLSHSIPFSPLRSRVCQSCLRNHLPPFSATVLLSAWFLGPF